MFYPYAKAKEIRKNSEITASAKTALKGHWVDAIGATAGILITAGVFLIFCGLFLYSILNRQLSLGNTIQSPGIWGPILIFALITGIVRWGQNVYGMAIIHWGLDLLAGRETSISKSFLAGLRLYAKLCLASILMTLIIVGKTLLLIVPGILAIMDYSLTIPCMMDEPDLGVRESLRRSRALMYGHRWQFFRLLLRFLGLGILCLFTLGIGFLWLWPCMLATCIAFYRDCLPSPEDEEACAKLPPVKRASSITGSLRWIIPAVALLLAILGQFFNAVDISNDIRKKLDAPEAVSSPDPDK